MAHPFWKILGNIVMIVILLALFVVGCGEFMKISDNDRGSHLTVARQD